MKRLLLFLIFSISFLPVIKADFNIWGSAIFLNINGSDDFYNTRQLSAPSAIGHNTFAGNLGIFGSNSGSFKLLGAEINTSRDNNFSICSGMFYYTVYPQGNRPAAPVFSAIPLGLYCNCSGGTFNNCGSGTCTGVNDQKLQNLSNSIDLTNFPQGNYTLEIYYTAIGQTGNSGCNLSKHDDNQGANYYAQFTISSPLAISFTDLNTYVGDDNIKIFWSIDNDLAITQYEVQKSSNGVNFQTIKTVNSNRLNAISNYIASDHSPFIGSNYYRIKSYFNNNTISISRIFRADFENAGNTLFIYPNPSGNQLGVRFAAVVKGDYQFSVLSTNGQSILSQPLHHDGLDKTIYFNLPVTLSRGVYRLFLIDKTHFYKQSFLMK